MKEFNEIFIEELYLDFLYNFILWTEYTFFCSWINLEPCLNIYRYVYTMCLLHLKKVKME